MRRGMTEIVWDRSKLSSWMCDYPHNSDVPKYGNALDVMIPLIAQFCVVCWLKEEKKIGFLAFKKDRVCEKLFFQNEFSMYKHKAFLLLYLSFYAFFSNE